MLGGDQLVLPVCEPTRGEPLKLGLTLGSLIADEADVDGAGVLVIEGRRRMPSGGVATSLGVWEAVVPPIERGS